MISPLFASLVFAAAALLGSNSRATISQKKIKILEQREDIQVFDRGFSINRWLWSNYLHSSCTHVCICRYILITRLIADQ